MSEEGKGRTLCRNEQLTCYLSATDLFSCVHSLFKNTSMNEALFFFLNNNPCSQTLALNILSYVHTLYFQCI